MGLIHIDLFTTLDGVAQAPGGPEEDTEGGFAFGGWQAPLIDEVVGEQVGAGMVDMDALLLGRKTYDIFAGYWPHHTEGPDGEIGRLFNRIPKYVASRHNPGLEWEHSTLLGNDLLASVRELRDRHANVHVIGSIDLAHTLLAERLFDRLTLMVYPIVLGQGKKVLPDGATPTNLILAEPAITSPKGAVVLRYARGEGVPSTGDMTAENPGV
ncbi:MAG: dihydrofolate reductase family protein [Acidimicrobiaceae bacterium]|nr:dihydrofolate reductase family protein [Acidimicrobiaceae bacterium]